MVRLHFPTLHEITERTCQENPAGRQSRTTHMVRATAITTCRRGRLYQPLQAARHRKTRFCSLLLPIMLFISLTVAGFCRVGDTYELSGKSGAHHQDPSYGGKVNLLSFKGRENGQAAAAAHVVDHPKIVHDSSYADEQMRLGIASLHCFTSDKESEDWHFKIILVFTED